MSVGHKLRMLFGRPVYTRPSIELAHQDYARSTPGEDVYVLSPIRTPRPVSGTVQVAVYCMLCAQQVPVEVSDVATTFRRVLMWRVAAWVSLAVFVGFAAWMLHGMFLVPEGQRPDTRFVWLLGYLPLCLTMLFVMDRLAKSDGVRLLDTENHELRENPNPDR